MSLIALDKYGEILSTNFDFVELQWTRKYRECGQFCLYMAAKDYPASMKYLQVNGRPETGIVQKVSYAKQPDGDFVTLEGFFLEKLADGGAYVFAVDMGFGGNARNSIESYLSWTLGKPHITTDSQYNIYSWSINSASTFPSTLTANIEQGTPVGKALYDVLSTDNWSYYCKPIWNPDKSTESTKPLIGLDFVFYKGVDRREDIYFGNAFKDVENIEYILDESAMVPLYHILQEVPEANWNSSMMIYQWVAGAAKFYLEDWLKVDANRPSGMGFIYPEKVFLSQVNGVDLIPANEAKIRAQMKQQATLDMLSNYKVERIECDVLQNRFYYLQDYDLGDVCSVVIDEIQQSFTARIIEVREVHAANKVDIQVVLGTPNKREYRKVG